jgi:ABC-2 type transport system ATP-binding protein
MALAIDVKELTKRYDATMALDRISFDVHAGEIMGFLGPNGAGKTTTLRILTGLLAPTSGSVTIDGLNAQTQSLTIRRRIGYMPENVALYPELRVREYLDYRAAIKGVARTQRRARVAAVMQQCAVDEVQRKLIGRLSKGYRQRVALADCLVGSPSILILDEPTIGLDPNQIRQTRELIKSLGQRTTILLSTHILPEVEMLCGRVTIINQGRIIAVDTPAKLRARAAGRQLVHVELRGEEAAIEPALRQLAGVSQVRRASRADLPAAPAAQAGGCVSFEIEASGPTDVREAIFTLAAARGWTVRHLSQTHASLEDVFVHLTTKEVEPVVPAR